MSEVVRKCVRIVGNSRSWECDRFKLSEVVSVMSEVVCNKVWIVVK